ncbi:alpha/beta fold hydrolase [Streptomyces sp. NPDC051286]|uniref:alpha/beta fold hydrolase n=1 Tax=Streptomyces sp. NPDC051286 TaxID=3365647 RepID=UPI00379B4B67
MSDQAPDTAVHPHRQVRLMHGAFVDASSWAGVIGRLQQDGYKVVAPANPLRGLESDAAYLRSVLDTIRGPIVLAGHSYGSSVISQAAAGDRQVKVLVHIAAFAPDLKGVDRILTACLHHGLPRVVTFHHCRTAAQDFDPPATKPASTDQDFPVPSSSAPGFGRREQSPGMRLLPGGIT